MRSENFENNRDLLIKWLHFLFLVQIAGVVISALSAVQELSSVLSWFSRMVSVCTIVCLFKMAAVNKRYQNAAIFLCITVGGGVVSVFIGNTILSLIVSICSIITAYQEFAAHSDITADKDPVLSRRWHSLFFWQLVIGLLGGFLSVTGVMLGVFAGAEIPVITSAVLLFVTVMNVIIKIIYLKYLSKTISAYRN